MTVKLFRRTTAGITALFFCLLLFFPAFSPAAALSGTTGRRTVRVGLPDSDIVETSRHESRMAAFEKDYMQAVSEYANWDCVYIRGSWDECLSMAKKGEIDVLPYVSKTADRMQYLDFASESMGTEMCYLFGRGNTTLRYDDYDSFDGMTVGCVKGSTMSAFLKKYGQAHGFQFRFRYFQTNADMFSALDAGKVDAVVQTSFYDTPSGHIILAKFNPNPAYIVTSKSDPSLHTELDSALSQLFSYSPSFNADLYRYHFGTLTAQAVSYTKQEAAYLASHPVVNVLYETNWEPFEYVRGKEAEGITPDVIRAIGQKTGITFRFVLSSSTQDIYASMDGVAADTIMAVSYDYDWANKHDLLVTQPYVSGSVMRVSGMGTSTPKTVATVKDAYLESQIRLKYPNLKTVRYANHAACMDAVSHGAADCTFLNSYQANYYRAMSAYRDFSYQPDENITQGIALGVTRSSNPALVGILSKSLQSLSSGTLQSILSENSTQTGDLTLHLLLRRYPIQMAAIIGTMGTLSGLLIVLLVSANQRKRQNLQLLAAKKEADAANSAKSEFLSRMSHDMRTPLNGILGMTYLTGRMDLPPQAQDNLRKIDTSSKFLLNLINDLLDMTKAESGKIELHPEPYPPEEFRQYIDAVIRPLCESKHQNLHLNIDIPEGIVPLQDKLRVNQIAFNLLSNAMKYTPEGGEITYTARAQVREDGRLSMCIQVADNGIGISEEFQKVLFTPFTQEGRNDNSEFRGSGLGLAITKQLVELMDGSISVESTVGRGSTFTAVFVSGWSSAGQVSPPSADTFLKETGGCLAGKHILLFEDHPLNQEITRALLAEKGIHVEIADDGQRGVSAFNQSPPNFYDAILMDLRMPVMDGYEATRTIRELSRPDAKTVPIFAMSADVFSDDIQKCLDAGMNGHIAKPIDPQTLYDTLTHAICTESKADL
jgi:signal transduction histidine kinase/ActR/RegA family two-component response regulator